MLRGQRKVGGKVGGAIGGEAAVKAWILLYFAVFSRPFRGVTIDAFRTYLPA